MSAVNFNGEITRFGIRGAATVSDAMYAAMVAHPSFYDPDNPEPVVEPVPTTTPDALPAPGQSVEEYVQASVRFMTDGAALMRIQSLVDDRIRTIQLSATGVLPLGGEAVPEPTRDTTPEIPDCSDNIELTVPEEPAVHEPVSVDPIGEAKAAEVVAIVSAVRDLDALDIYETAEQGGKARSTVLKAIDERRKVLSGA